MSSADPLSLQLFNGEVFVTGIPAGVDKAKLRAVLEQFGPIDSISVKKTDRGDRDNFAFVHFNAPADADKAVDAGNRRKVKIGETTLMLKWSQNRTPQGGGSRSRLMTPASNTSLTGLSRPGPDTRGWQCRDPNCRLWNEEVSTNCVQCNLTRAVLNQHPQPPGRIQHHQQHSAFTPWEHQQQQQQPCSASAASVTALKATINPNLSLFSDSSSGAGDSALAAAMANISLQDGANSSAFYSNPAGRGRGQRAQQRLRMYGMQQQQHHASGPSQDQLHQNVSQLESENALKEELRRARARCQALEKELKETKKAANAESHLASVVRMRKSLVKKRSEAATLNPSLITECVKGLLRASDGCIRSQPKVYDRVKKGINYYKSFSSDCEDGDEAEMNRLAKESAAKALSVSMGQYLTTFPYQEMSDITVKAEMMANRMLEEKPWLRTVGPKPLDQDAVKVLEGLQANEAFCPDHVKATDEAYEELCGHVEKLSEALRGQTCEKSDVKEYEECASKVKEVMQQEHEKWKKTKLDTVQTERVKDLYGHLFWCRQRLAQLILQYKDVYRVAGQLEQEHGLKIINEEVMSDPEKAIEDEDLVQAADDATASDGGDKISQDDNLSDVLTFSDDDENNDESKSKKKDDDEEEKGAKDDDQDNE